MDKVSVSICCLTYNHEHYIEECLKGFLMQQTNFSFEILIHDDASTDNTLEIITNYEKKHPELFRVVKQNVNQFSQGIQPFFKFLFPIANGKYIAYCEGDDFWTDPLKLQKQVDFMERNEHIQICSTNYNILRGNRLIKSLRKTKLQIFSQYDLILKNRTGTLTGLIRNNFKIPNYLSEAAIGDLSLLLFLTGNKGKLAVLPFNSAVFRVNEKGIYSGASIGENMQKGFSDKILFLKHNKKDPLFLFYSIIGYFKQSSTYFIKAFFKNSSANFRYAKIYLKEISNLVQVYLRKSN
ncbi:Glycosyltransferase involved in cell wall bisynthesis [Salegentibacter agarivorans]|uniref:Glycosyltransferase involved in cell wall bisynthesis n=1 Tax=Salegentibacter agarivorans TaxID=345907 RepID=A0A1I2JZ91_9FLAO|nr:glycosyltransferase [Salegentibacter agarivorans]SFF60242.1 Glycosyltransferase involved in cell wall bisynthesis [Salegentibacter agarivorans]